MYGKDSGILNIAEIPYDTGEVRFRYAIYLSEDRTCWIRHGLFTYYYKSGQIASTGLYEDGLETGLWHDYYENGQLAAEGEYLNGKEHGIWKFWLSDGMPERNIRYDNGVEVDLSDR